MQNNDSAGLRARIRTVAKGARMPLYLLAIELIIVLDQWVKIWSADTLRTGGSRPFISGIVRLSYCENVGAAFGMLANQRWIFITLTVILVAAAQYLLFSGRLAKPLQYIPAIFIIGGGIGNLIDRIVRGYVVDMFDLEFMDFAVFNVADSFVVVGAVLIILYLILSEIGEWRNRKRSDPDNANINSQ